MNQTVNNSSSSIIHKLGIAALIMVICVVLLSNEPAQAQSGGSYILDWSTIDGGGGQSSGGSYTLTSTIGQPDADWSSGGDYELLGGFWPGGPLCTVDFEHFARFAEYWLDAPCDAGNDWCGGADLDYLNGVNLIDLGLFVDEWLYYCPYNWPLK